MTTLDWSEPTYAWDVISFDWNGDEILYTTDPSAIETATGRLASLAATGALQTLHSTGHLPFPLVHRGIYDPHRHATGKAVGISQDETFTIGGEGWGDGEWGVMHWGGGSYLYHPTFGLTARGALPLRTAVGVLE